MMTELKTLMALLMTVTSVVTISFEGRSLSVPQPNEMILNAVERAVPTLQTWFDEKVQKNQKNDRHSRSQDEDGPPLDYDKYAAMDLDELMAVEVRTESNYELEELPQEQEQSDVEPEPGCCDKSSYEDSPRKGATEAGRAPHS